MALPFGPYEGQDLTEYEAGNKFLPRQFYSLGLPNTPPPSIANAPTGITNTQAANPYIYPPQGGGDGGGFANAYGYDPNKTKTFSKDVWTGEVGGPGNRYGGWKTQDVTGYWSPSGWKTAQGKNINHAGLEVPSLIGSVMNKWMGTKVGEKQVGDIKGTFTDSNWFGEEEDDPIAAAAIQRNLLNKIRAQAYKGPINVGGGAQDIPGDGDPEDPPPRFPTSTWTPAGDGGDKDRSPSSAPDRGRARGKGETGQIAGGHHFAQGGRIGLYAGGDPEEPAENVFEFMQDQNIPHGEMVEADPFDLRIQELMGKGLSYEDAYDIAAHEFQDLFTEGSEQDQGLASLV